MKFRSISGVLACLAAGWLFPQKTQAQCDGIQNCGPIDAVFILDKTGSMGGAIGNVVSEIANIVRTIDCASGGDYRLGHIAYGAEVYAHTDLGEGMVGTNNSALFQSEINLPADGGGSLPENAIEAMRLALTAAPGPCQNGTFVGTWRPAARKIIINITDATATDCSNSASMSPALRATAISLAVQANAMGVQIVSINVPTPTQGGDPQGPQVAPLLLEQSTISGGCYRLANPDGTGTAAAIIDCLSSCGRDACAELSDTFLTPVFDDRGFTGCFDYTFKITNNSGQTAQSILFPAGPNFTITPAFVQFGSPGLASGATTSDITIRICGEDIVNDTFALPIILFNRENQECCRIVEELNFELDDCFEFRVRPTLQCGPNGTQFLDVTIIPTAYSVGHIFVLPQRPPSGSIPVMENGYFAGNLTRYLSNRITFPLRNGTAGNEYCFEIIVHKPDLSACCSRIICLRYPDCPECPGCPRGSACDPIDFNNDSLFPDDMDLVDFLSVLAGGPCSNAPFCNDIDFNNDGLFPSDADVVSFLSVRAGGGC